MLSLYYSNVWQAKITSKLSEKFKIHLTTHLKFPPGDVDFCAFANLSPSPLLLNIGLINFCFQFFFSNTCTASSTWIRKCTLQCLVMKIHFLNIKLEKEESVLVSLKKLQHFRLLTSTTKKIQNWRLYFWFSEFTWKNSQSNHLWYMDSVLPSDSDFFLNKKYAFKCD